MSKMKNEVIEDLNALQRGHNPKCKVTIENEDGQTLFLNIENIIEQQELNIQITGTPENLKEHKGLHFTIAGYFLDSLKLKE